MDLAHHWGFCFGINRYFSQNKKCRSHGCQPSLCTPTTQQRHPLARWHHIKRSAKNMRLISSTISTLIFFVVFFAAGLVPLEAFFHLFPGVNHWWLLVLIPYYLGIYRFVYSPVAYHLGMSDRFSQYDDWYEKRFRNKPNKTRHSNPYQPPCLHALP